MHFLSFTAVAVPFLAAGLSDAVSLGHYGRAGYPELVGHRRQVSQCTEPVVRKEWRELSSEEKADYLRAANCVRDLPATAYPYAEPVVSRMDELTWTHLTLNDEIHFVANFLPWHRWFLKYYEDALRNECGYKGYQPYWDWSIDGDTQSVATSPIWDPVEGFGGNGAFTGNDTRGFNHCVTDGPFANRVLSIGPVYPEFNDRVDEPHCLTRVFNEGIVLRNPDGTINASIGTMQSTAYDSNAVARILDMTNFADHADILEGLPHAQIHSIISGDMGPASSRNEPIFFLHHGNLDRIWAKWQAQAEERLTDYSGFKDQGNTIPASLDDSMPVMALDETEPVVRDYMNIKAGPLCYEYSQ